MEQQVRNIEVYQNKAEVGPAQEKAQSTIRRVAAYCRVSTLLKNRRNPTTHNAPITGGSSTEIRH